MSDVKDNLVCRPSQHSKLPPHEVLVDKHPQHGDDPKQNFLPDLAHHLPICLWRLGWHLVVLAAVAHGVPGAETHYKDTIVGFKCDPDTPRG